MGRCPTHKDIKKKGCSHKFAVHAKFMEKGNNLIHLELRFYLAAYLFLLRSFNGSLTEHPIHAREKNTPELSCELMLHHSPDYGPPYQGAPVCYEAPFDLEGIIRVTPQDSSIGRYHVLRCW
ncbi:hypothetical protein R1flu_012968 [Riccia fluitans]|uniref:Uncharacterized protein n=1 Tax=Riccia fluitans TaxID=41844 RepID=A0ABD1ZC56_9MARC